MLEGNLRKKFIQDLIECAEIIRKLVQKVYGSLIYEPNLKGYRKFVKDKFPKEIWTELNTKYESWYNKSKIIIRQINPEELHRFELCYDDPKSPYIYRGIHGLLDLNLEYTTWSNSGDDIIHEFERLFKIQVSILSSISDSIEANILLDVTQSNASIDQLKEILIQMIYNLVVTQPNIWEKNSRYIPEAKKNAIKKRDKNQCQLCGKFFNENELEIDHIFPFSLGGSNEEINLMSLCRICNADKSNSTKYYQNESGKFQLKLNIKNLVENLPIIMNFGNWIKTNIEHLKKNPPSY